MAPGTPWKHRSSLRPCRCHRVPRSRRSRWCRSGRCRPTPFRELPLIQIEQVDRADSERAGRFVGEAQGGLRREGLTVTTAVLGLSRSFGLLMNSRLMSEWLDRRGSLVWRARFWGALRAMLLITRTVRCWLPGRCVATWRISSRPQTGRNMPRERVDFAAGLPLPPATHVTVATVLPP